MKRRRAKMGAAVGCWEGSDRTNQDWQRSWGDLPPQTEMTLACRDLKDTVRVGGRTVISIGGRMFMIGIVVMRLGNLVEKMMHPMGRGID